MVGTLRFMTLTSTKSSSQNITLLIRRSFAIISTLLRRTKWTKYTKNKLKKQLKMLSNILTKCGFLQTGNRIIR